MNIFAGSGAITFLCLLFGATVGFGWALFPFFGDCHLLNFSISIGFLKTGTLFTEACLRENDISVSRLHAFIKYENGQFVVIDNNSKFGTLVLLRKNYRIEKKKIALQIGRTVLTFSLKHASVNNVPVFKNPMLMEKFSKWQSPKNGNNSQPKPTVAPNNKHKNVIAPPVPETDKQENNSNNNNFNLNGSFID